MSDIPSRGNSVTFVVEERLENQTPHATSMLERAALLVQMVSAATAVCSMLQCLMIAAHQLTGKYSGL